MIATRGHRLLTDYAFDPGTGLWRHRAGRPAPPLRLTGLRFGPDGITTPPPAHQPAGEDALAGYLQTAADLLDARADEIDQGPTGLPDDFEALRWFTLPPACLAPIDDGAGPAD